MWKDKIVLAEGEEIVHESSKTSGFMQEEDIDVYSVVRKDGTKTGSIRVSDHTAVKGFRRTVHVVQTDLAGRTVVDVSFNPK